MGTRGIYKIGTLSKLTGVPQGTLRSWEDRLGLLEPERTDGQHRLYSEEDRRCVLAAKAMLAAGRSIAEIAALGRPALLDYVSAGNAPARSDPGLPVSAEVILDSLEDAVLAVVPDGRIVYATAGVEGLLGWQPAALLGRSVRTLVNAPIVGGALLSTGPGAPTRRNAGVAGRHRDGSPVSLEVTVVRGKGSASNVAIVTLRRSRDVAATVARVVEELVTMHDAALARVWLSDEPHVLRLRASAGLSRQVETSSRARIDVRSYPNKVGTVARSGLPFVGNDIAGEPGFDAGWVQREGLRSVAVLPLIARGELRGVLASFFRRALEPAEVDAVTGLASEIAAAL